MRQKLESVDCQISSHKITWCKKKDLCSFLGPWDLRTWGSVWVHPRFSSFPNTPSIDVHFCEIVQKESGTMSIHSGRFVLWFTLKQHLSKSFFSALEFKMCCIFWCFCSIHFGTWARWVGSVLVQLKSKLYRLQCSSDEGQRQKRQPAPAEPLRAVCSQAACRE